jgi:acetyl esterase/lipase
MPSWLILALALALAGPSALTALRAPTILVWKTALLVGEFGHFLWLLSLLLAVLAWHLDAGGPVANFARWLTLPFCLGSGLLLLKPVLQARQVARKLPDRLRRAFGPVALDRAPFSLTGLRPASGPPVTVSTRVYTRPGTPDELSLDFYAAVRTDGRPAPCVVLIHGGGWFSGGRTELAGLDRWLARRGYAVAAIDYRLAPQHHWPDPADDVGAAITWLRGHADELGLDPQRFVLLGRSAGGQIATAFAYSRSDPVVRGVVSFYGPQDLRFFWKLSRRVDPVLAPEIVREYLGGPPDEAPAAVGSASGYLLATPTSPPTLLVHGSLDILVSPRESERLQARLDQLGVPNALVLLPWGGHAFDYNLGGPGGQLATYALEWFLAAVTK